MISGNGSESAYRSGAMGQDLAWKYCTLMEGNRNDTVCNYYGLLIKSGGITWFKFHLSHIDLNSNTKMCLKSTSQSEIRVKRAFALKKKKKSKAKVKKAANI